MCYPGAENSCTNQEIDMPLVFKVLSHAYTNLNLNMVLHIPMTTSNMSKSWSLVIVSVELQTGQCEEYIYKDWVVLLKYLYRFPVNAAQLLHISGASPRIWAYDTRSLLLVWPGWDLGMRLIIYCTKLWFSTSSTLVAKLIKFHCTLFKFHSFHWCS